MIGAKTLSIQEAGFRELLGIRLYLYEDDWRRHRSARYFRVSRA